ncbi:DUF4825 domain-containing protein [Bacillus marinisedimentorum]|uniref:DUF4825 domain-containing protein n=1 Tax=Bacillus marinisedimentorum TaxID=1821260 RepID=UPI0007E0E6A1|nr:DUF4825 domain-containing protein [Bacillus marinisedimentorum]
MTKKLLLLLMSFSLLLNGCSSVENAKEDIFGFKGTYIGDANTLGNMIRQLPSAEYFEGMELKTKEKPYGMVLAYSIEDEPVNEAAVKKTVLANAAFLFALVKNADWITFAFGDQRYTVTKEDLQKWYGKELASFKSADDLENLIQISLRDGMKVDEFFNDMNKAQDSL